MLVLRYISIVLISLVSLTSLAQITYSPELDLLNESSLQLSGANSTGGLVFIDQLGDNNTAEVEQRRQRTQTNETRVLQRGDNNRATLQQAGTNNRVALLQKGYDNRYSLDLTGVNTDLAVVQNGDRNEVRQRLENTRDVRLEFIQNGDANLIEYEVEGLQSKGLRVIQDGSNMQLIINKTTALSPSGS